MLNIMREAVIAEVSTQLSEVVGVIERHLEPTLLAVHLYGSAVDGGLKPHSDIDLLVTAVSYTHLDVYKRQTEYGGFPTITLISNAF